MQLGQGGCLGGDSEEAGNAVTVVDAKFTQQAGTLLTNGLIQHQRAIGIGNRTVEGARGNPQNIAATIKAHNMEGIVPAQVYEIEGTPPMHGQ